MIRFDTSNYNTEKQILRGKSSKVIGLMKDELGGKVMAEFIVLRPKTYSYLRNDNDKNKKAKGTKKCVIKKNTEFEDYEYCLEATQLEIK